MSCRSVLKRLDMTSIIKYKEKKNTDLSVEMCIKTGTYIKSFGNQHVSMFR